MYSIFKYFLLFYFFLEVFFIEKTLAVGSGQVNGETFPP